MAKRRKTIKAIFQRASIVALLATSFHALDILSGAPVMAEDNGQTSVIDEMFSRFDVVPGKAWYRLAGERRQMAPRASDRNKPVLPGPMVGDIERQMGVKFCKYVQDGVVYSNLKICATYNPETGGYLAINHPFMENPQKGIIRAPTGNIGLDYAHYMPPSYKDLPTARAVEASLKGYRWPAPEVMVAARTVTPVAVEESRPVVEVARPVPRPDVTSVVVNGQKALIGGLKF